MNVADNPICRLLNIEYPIIQAPMAGASTPEMAAAASNAGALGSLGCAMMKQDPLRQLGVKMSGLTNRTVNYNFFCHSEPVLNQDKGSAASAELSKYYDEFGLDEMPEAVPTHYPFNDEICDAVLESSPKVVSFHFGLPPKHLMQKLKDAGCVILSSATTAAEARYLEDNGADAIIAQGFEGGGHRGFFLESEDACIGTMALVPSVVDAVTVPVIAAGGIADGRGIKAAFALGACAIQIGTAFLNCKEAGIPEVHKENLISLTKIFYS